MFGSEFREETKENLPRKCSKIAQFYFLFYLRGGFVGIYIDFVTLQLRKPLSGHQLRMA